jgi:FtsH-binding integral membrane protein
VRQLATEWIAPDTDERAYFTRVFGWMAVALAVTGAVAAAIGHSQRAVNTLVTSGGGWVFIGLVLIELLLVGALVGLVQHMDVVEAAAIFVGYAALNGVTVSVIFAVFTTKSIFSTLFVTAAMFGALALWGYVTNADLTRWGSFLFMALIGQLIGVVVNVFWLNETLYWVTTATGVLIFSAYTAYDVQKLKRYEPPPGSDAEVVEKDAIVGALALYLDFVNLFLYLLRLFGRRR